MKKGDNDVIKNVTSNVMGIKIPYKIDIVSRVTWADIVKDN